MGTWVPPDQQTPAWVVMHRGWLVNIPVMETRSIDHIRHFGVPSVGDPTYDRQMTNERIQTMKTINEMVELFDQGAHIYVVNPKDTKLMYESIEQLLHEWKQKMDGFTPTDTEVVEYLVKLDKLATAVYAHAKPLLDVEVVESWLARQLRQQGRGRILPRTLDKPIEQHQDEPIAPREGMADIFNRRRAELGSTGDGFKGRWS